MQACLLLCLLAAQTFASPFAARQISDASDSSDISVIGFSVTQERPTSTTTVLSTKTEYTIVTLLPAGAVVSVVPYTVIVSGSITQLKSATVMVYPATAHATAGSSSSSTATSSSSKRNGAIAGGVVGAVVVAAIAAVLCMRFCNKRSLRHWRNRGLKPWLKSDGGSGGDGDVKRPPSPIIASPFANDCGSNFGQGETPFFAL